MAPSSTPLRLFFPAFVFLLLLALRSGCKEEPTVNRSWTQAFTEAKTSSDVVVIYTSFPSLPSLLSPGTVPSPFQTAVC